MLHYFLPQAFCFRLLHYLNFARKLMNASVEASKLPWKLPWKIWNLWKLPVTSTGASTKAYGSFHESFHESFHGSPM